MKSTKPLSMFSLFQTGLLFVIVCVAGVAHTNAQTCNHVPVGGGESITGWVVHRDTGAPIADGSTLASGTWVKIHALGTADGQCLARVMVEGVCTFTGQVWERTVNNITRYVNITSSGSLNGDYFQGLVVGMNANGTTAYFHVLDSSQSNTTGPKVFLLPYAGTYIFRQKTVINKTPCNMEPGQTDWHYITLYVGGSEEEAAAANSLRRLRNENVRLATEGWRSFLNKPATLLSENWLS